MTQPTKRRTFIDELKDMKSMLTKEEWKYLEANISKLNVRSFSFLFS